MVPAELMGLETIITFTDPDTTRLENVTLMNVVPVDSLFTLSVENEIMLLLNGWQYTFTSTVRGRDNGRSNCSSTATTQFITGFNITAS